MRRQIGELLRKILKVEVRKSGGNRPLWKLLPALEHRRTGYLSDQRLPSWKAIRMDLRDTASAQDEAMTKVLEQWDECARENLTYMTQSEVAALAEFALSGPGVVLGRSLYRFDDNCMAGERYTDLLSASWNGLRTVPQPFSIPSHANEAGIRNTQRRSLKQLLREILNPCWMNIYG